MRIEARARGGVVGVLAQLLERAIGHLAARDTRLVGLDEIA